MTTKLRGGVNRFHEATIRTQQAVHANAAALDLNGLGLTELPSALRDATQLKQVDLDGNYLSVLPSWFPALRNLETLYLRNNRFKTLPTELQHLKKLRHLRITRNQLTTVPDWIGELSHLEEFRVSENAIVNLPETLGELQTLKVLDLADNALEGLPTSLRALSGLVELTLQRNEKLGLPPEVLANRPADIIEYYFQLSCGNKPLNEAKLILVGRGGVGKTSLANRLQFDRFDPDERKTEGIRISSWDLSIGTESVRLNLWDFGGQEIMHATHQFFLTQRTLYLLVLEGRQGAEDADSEYWLKLIESFGTDSNGDISPVIIVLNKIRSVQFELNRRALLRKYAFIQGFVSTDCEDGSGTIALRAMIQAETDRLKYLRAPFPVSWFAIKDKLARMKEKLSQSFISYDQYRAVCAEAGESEKAAQDSLASHLHNLGIALNYKDDPRLRDTHVLDPHWVTNGIYGILNSRLANERRGDIFLREADDILNASEYPRQMHRFLFDLMKKFQLCFSFPDDDTHYLIPELLDKEEPESVDRFPADECLNFEYRYTVLPEGLIPRFIVRSHVLSTGRARWRSGVILGFEGNEALVKADIQDKRVLVSVRGVTDGQRRLLAVIRSDFERIHSETRLAPKSFVPVPKHSGEFISYDELLIHEREAEHLLKRPIDGRLITLDVRALLEGVDLTSSDQRQGSALRGLRMFYSYSHKDEALRDELETHLKILERAGLITGWSDRKIVPGDQWADQIDENLERADIILLLVSADFMASDYCFRAEMQRAMERHRTRKARVIPIIVRDVLWNRAPFAKLEALPKDAIPVTTWVNRDSAWRSVCEGIESAISELRGTDKRRPKTLSRRAKKAMPASME
jgi:internalin A